MFKKHSYLPDFDGTIYKITFPVKTAKVIHVEVLKALKKSALVFNEPSNKPKKLCKKLLYTIPSCSSKTREPMQFIPKSTDTNNETKNANNPINFKILILFSPI